MAPRLEEIGWPVRTERLLLRQTVVTDLEPTWQFRRLEEVNRWLTSAPSTLKEYRSNFEDPDRRAKMLVIEQDGTVIGDLMVAIESAWAQAEMAGQAHDVQAELGWCLDPAYGDRGFVTEAVGAVLRLCFEDLGLRRVTAGCFADNTASRRLMERLGMRCEVHTLRESLHRSGEWLDGMGYALLAEEWRAATAPPG